jgi:hypothetical protein
MQIRCKKSPSDLVSQNVERKTFYDNPLFVQSFIVELQPCVQDIILKIVGLPFVEFIYFSFSPPKYT